MTRAVRLVGLILSSGAATGCARLPHPAALVGQWIDTNHSTPSDTAIWVLDPRGHDLAMHVAAQAAPSVEPYGRWYLYGAIADTTQRALCFLRRPGRDAPQCTRFRVDTVAVGSSMRRTLTLADYRGAHASGPRVLVERAP